MGSRIFIRNMEINDLNNVFKLGNSIFSNNCQLTSLEWNESNLAEIYAKNTNLCFVAARNKQIIGFIIGKILKNRTEENKAHILWFGLLNKLIGKNIETDLYTYFKNEAFNRGIDTIKIEISEKNKDVMEYLYKNGFIIREKNVIMEHKL